MYFWSRLGGLFQNISITLRMGLVVATALFAFASAAFVYWGGEKAIKATQLRSSKYSTFAQTVIKAEGSFKDLKLNLALYTGRHDQAASGKFRKSLAIIDEALSALSRSAEQSFGSFTPLLTPLRAMVSEIDGRFARVESLISLQGYTHQSGLWKSLEESRKDLKKEIDAWPNTEKLKSKLAVMRSHEAIFMLQKEPQALQHHKKTFNEFDFALWETDFDKATRNQFINLIKKYRSDLEAFAQADDQVAGAVLNLKKAITASSPLFDALFAASQEGINEATQMVELTKQSTERTITVAVGVVMAIYCFLSLLLVRSVTVPLKRIRFAMDRLASGDTTGDIPDRNRSDEIGAMAMSVEIFKRGLIKAKTLEEEKNQAAARQDSRRATLETAIGKFEEGIAGVLASIDHASRGMDSSASGVSEAASQTHNQVDRATMNSVEASQSVRAVAQATEELSVALSAISSRVKTSAAVARNASQKAEYSKTSITGLKDATGKVAEILGLIKGIADKTRLLSLNANIEATRAGAVGKGFAVVAKEVKELAAQTALATQQVGRQLSNITGEADNAIASIDQVYGAILEAQTHSEEIAKVILNQERTTKMIASNIQTASDSAASATDTISFVRDTAEGTKKVANDVSHASETLALHSRFLREEVESFLTGIRAA